MAPCALRNAPDPLQHAHRSGVSTSRGRGKDLEGTQTTWRARTRHRCVLPGRQAAINAKLRFCLPAVAAALVCGGTSPAQTTPWKDYLGGPAASHYSPLKQINTGNVNKLEVAWTYPTEDEVSYTFSPLVVDNIAYFAAKQGSLIAVDASTGKELWVHP